MAWYRWQGSDLLLELHVQANARVDGADGLHGGALRMRIKAPARDNKANDALLRRLAREFGVPRRRVMLERGRGQRNKVVRIVDPAATPGWFEPLGGARTPD